MIFQTRSAVLCRAFALTCAWLVACSSQDPSTEASGDELVGGQGGGGGFFPFPGGGAANAPVRTSPMPLLADGFYPRAILRANGTIMASVVQGQPGGQLGATVLESTDGGVSFNVVGRVDDPRNKAGLCCGTLFELPRAVGALPAQTLLWSASVGGDIKTAPMTLPVWKSTDNGRTWAFLTNVVRAAVNKGDNHGLWEPEFALLDDGRLVCYWSDETDNAHSQKLVEASSTDGINWTPPRDTVALGPVATRPGMANVRRLGKGSYLMSYELCGPTDGCTAFFRTSTDGWDWGNVSDAGFRVQTLDGKRFRHAPTLAWSGAPGANGRFFMVGQMTYDANGAVAPENGNVIFASSEGGFGNWYSVPAPVPVPKAFDNFCPNYSSTLLPLENGTVGLEIASQWDGTVCRPYFARGPLTNVTDTSEITTGSSYSLTSVVSGMCLDVQGGSQAAGGNVWQFNCTGNPAQIWTANRAANGTVALSSRISGQCLAVAGGSVVAGANVEQQPCNGSAAQAWSLRAVGLGYYELKHAGSGSCLDVAGGSSAVGGNVQQWSCNDLAPQIWHMQKL